MLPQRPLGRRVGLAGTLDPRPQARRQTRQGAAASPLGEHLEERDRQRHPEGVPLKGKHATFWKTASSGGPCPVTPQAYVPDLPHWSTVYHYFRKWQKEGVWEKVAQALVRRDREREGRYASPSALVMDSQSVKTGEKGGPVDTTGRRSRA
ncbi:hypothetical protein CSW47_16275 [Thermus scotoductus]|uniref:Transposase n=1 Tax=Thermus scotoductus TaxID=37636 RepID=A0A430QVZ6_THESC|nr:hypothetical protein CSW47_16275 [Thermus scotoductus]